MSLRCGVVWCDDRALKDGDSSGESQESNSLALTEGEANIEPVLSFIDGIVFREVATASAGALGQVAVAPCPVCSSVFVVVGSRGAAPSYLWTSSSSWILKNSFNPAGLDG
jgi:hypothetical protein